MRLRYEERKGDGHGQGKKRHRLCGTRVAEGVRVGGNAYARAGKVDERAGDYGVRDPRRRFGRHRYPGDHGFPPEIARALERYCGGDQRTLAGLPRKAAHAAQRAGSLEKLRCEQGQSTVEFAVVMAGFLSLTVALGIMWRAFGGGIFVEQALAVASHHIQTVAPVTIADVFLY